MLQARNTVAIFFFASKYYRCLFFRAGHVIIVGLRLSVWIFVVKIHAAITGDERAQEEAARRGPGEELQKDDVAVQELQFLRRSEAQP